MSVTHEHIIWASREYIAVLDELKKVRVMREELVKKQVALEEQILKYIERSPHDAIITETHVLEPKMHRRSRALPQKQRREVLERMIKEQAPVDTILGQLVNKLPDVSRLTVRKR